MDIHGRLRTLDFVVIAVYLLALLGVGFWASFRKKRSHDLFLAGRQFGWANIGFSIWATNISPSTLIGFCGIGYALGIVGGNYSWLAWPLLILLGMVFVPHYLNTKVSTMPEFLGRRFGDSCRRFLSWYVLFSTLTGWLGLTLYAGGLLLGQVMQWPFAWSVLFLAVLCTSFTVAGGLEAVVFTDTFQSILIIGGSVVLTVIGLEKAGGVEKLWHSVPPDFWKLFQTRKDPTFDFNWYSVLPGYFVAGIWYWCTDQTIVQRVLGARDLRQAQLGTVFAGFLKILDVGVFLLPGIICRVLHPGLKNSDDAYVLMVTTYLPVGLVGLVVSVLIAALVSTVDAGLNSFSTVFTLDIYRQRFRPQATPRDLRRVGRLTVVVASLLSMAIALGLHAARNRSLFELGMSIGGFLAPPMAAVFLVGVLWKRANRQAALSTLVFGTLGCVAVGVCFLANWPHKGFWPPFPLLSFELFAGLCVWMTAVSLLTAPPGPEQRLATLPETYRQQAHSSRTIWVWWFVLAAVMTALYLFFN